MFIEDFRRAASRLRSSVATLALTVGMLAVAIGVTAAMFTVLDALVLHPVPFREASRLTSVVLTNGEGFMSTVPGTLLGAWRDSRVFEGIEGAAQSPVTLDTGQELVTRGGARITPGMLAMLGVQPIIGRGFLEGEGRAGADDRILLSEELWQTLFNRDPGVIGRRIRVSGVSTEVIGVLPASFRFPYANVRAWRPIDFTAPPPDLQRVRPMAFARLAAGIPPPDSLRAAESAARSASALPDGTSLMFRPIAAGMVDKYSRRSIMTLSAGVGLVFLVLCANAMNLMLTRFSERQREFGMCSALGASRARLVREALAETLLLGLAASIAGLLLAHALVELVTNYLPDAFLTRTLTPVALSWRAVAVTSALGILAAAIAGVVPAWMATKVTRSLRSGWPAAAVPRSRLGAGWRAACSSPRSRWRRRCWLEPGCWCGRSST